MGKKGEWLVAFQRVFSTDDPKEKEKKKQRRNQKRRGSWVCGSCAKGSYDDPSDDAPEPEAPPTPRRAASQREDAENEQSKHAYSVAIATAVAAEAAVVAAKAAAEVVRLTTPPRFTGRSTEEAAATKIQTVFRGYLARRSLRALKGLVRLQLLVDGEAAKRQTANTLHCLQTLARVQSQIRSRRNRMTEENQALHRQLQLKHQRELEKFRMGEEWDDSTRSKEQIEASLLIKQEAAMRRERALAYAFSHQWKCSSRSVNPMFMDPNNPQWGWSWLERWMSARPWESRGVSDIDHTSVKIAGGEITKAHGHRDTNSPHVARKTSRPSSRQSPTTPLSKASSVAARTKPPSPRPCCSTPEDDSRSMFSLQSERYRRNSIGGSSARDDESFASSPAIPSYMAPTHSAKARSRFQSPSSDRSDTPDRLSVGSAKKRLSFPATEKQHSTPSPSRMRRHSGPPKVDIGPMNDLTL